MLCCGSDSLHLGMSSYIMQQFSQKIEEDCRKAEAIKNADFRASEDGDWNVRRVSNGLYIPNSIELWEDMQ